MNEAFDGSGSRGSQASVLSRRAPVPKVCQNRMFSCHWGSLRAKSKFPKLDAGALAGNNSVLAVIQPPQELACRIEDPVEQQAEKQQGG